MGLHATDADLAQLGKDIIACRVAKGTVPDNCTGVHHSGKQTQFHGAGAGVKEPSQGKLWWISNCIFFHSFAPSPQTPEAGIKIGIQFATDHGYRDSFPHEDIAEKLTRYCSPTFVVTDVERIITDNTMLRPQPAMQADELERLRTAISRKLTQEAGLRCIHLERVDLFELGVNHATSPAKPDEPNQDTVPRGSAPQQASPKTSPLPSVQDIIQLDEVYQYRLFRELPRLAQTLREHPWPEDTAAFEAQKAVLVKLEHLASTTNRLPALANRIDPRSMPPSTVRLLGAECQKAIQTLDAAWLQFEDSALPISVSKLADIVAEMETAIARRRTPWWQVE